VQGAVCSTSGRRELQACPRAGRLCGFGLLPARVPVSGNVNAAIRRTEHEQVLTCWRVVYTGVLEAANAM
jgi:hypothetical protein